MSGFGRSIVVGGCGAVGGMFADLLREAGSQTLVVDIAPPPEERTSCLVADITAPGPELSAAVAGADLVVLAVHEAVALKAVAPVTRLMRPGALLADTLSVRTAMAEELATRAPGIEHVGLNPMFAPAAGDGLPARRRRDHPGRARSDRPPAADRTSERLGPSGSRRRNTTGPPPPPRP
ncbi:NAD(P)-binding domain-containing protein [Streptomyces lasalocidi]